MAVSDKLAVSHRLAEIAMAHPYASQAKASQKRRLSALGAKAGKSFGSSSMYKKTSYPSKGAGTSRELTISGGAALKRADRAPQKLASGGFVGGGMGGKKKSRKGHSTTNIVIASPGGGQAAAPPRPVPIPVPVNRPVPVPVGGSPGGLPPRPPVGPPGAGGPPINVNVPPPAAAGPVGPPPPMPVNRPPGMAKGGSVGYTYHNWGKGFANGGSVKKKANGGPIGIRGGPPGVDISQSGDSADAPDVSVGGVGGGLGTSFDGRKVPVPAGAPPPVGAQGAARLMSMSPDEARTSVVNTPTSQAGIANLESQRTGPDPNFLKALRGEPLKKGGAVKKRQFGGGTGQAGLGPRGVPPRKPFTPGAVPGAMGGQKSPIVPLTPPTGGRPTRPGYNKGGKIKKYQDGGGGYSATDSEEDPTPQASSTSVTTPADSSGGSMKGVMKALTGVNKVLNPAASGSSAGAYGVKAAQGAQDAATKAGQAVAGSTQSLARSSQSAGFKPGAVPGAPGAGGKFSFNKGGSVKRAGAGSGLGRLAASKRI